MDSYYESRALFIYITILTIVLITLHHFIYTNIPALIPDDYLRSNDDRFSCTGLRRNVSGTIQVEDSIDAPGITSFFKHVLVREIIMHDQVSLIFTYYHANCALNFV